MIALSFALRSATPVEGKLSNLYASRHGADTTDLESAMKDAYEVLQKKQADLDRVRKEIESLKIAERLLSEDRASDDPNQDRKLSPGSLNDTISRLSDSAAANAEKLFPAVNPSRSGFWNSLKRAT